MSAWDEEPTSSGMEQAMDIDGGWDDAPVYPAKNNTAKSGFDDFDAPSPGKQGAVASIYQGASESEDWGAVAEQFVAAAATVNKADDPFDSRWEASVVADTVCASIAVPANDPFDEEWDVPGVLNTAAAIELADAPAAGGLGDSANADAPVADPYAAKATVNFMRSPPVLKKAHVIREDLREKADGKNFADSFIPQLSAQYEESVIDQRKSDDTLPIRRQDISWIYGKNTEEMIRKSSKNPAPAEENKRSQKSYIHYNGNRNTANHEWINFQIRYLIALMAKSYHEFGDRAADESYKDKKQRIDRKRQFNKSLGVAHDITMRDWAFQDVTESLNMWCISANEDEISASDVKEMMYRLVTERKSAYKFTQAQKAGGRLTRTIAMVWKKSIDFDGSKREWKNGGRAAALEAKKAQEERSRNPGAVGAVGEITNAAGIQAGWNSGGDADAKNTTAAVDADADVDAQADHGFGFCCGGGAAATSIDEGIWGGGGTGGEDPVASFAVNDDDEWGGGGFANAAASSAFPVRSREPDPLGDPLPLGNYFGRTAATAPVLNHDLGDRPVAAVALPPPVDDDWSDSVRDFDNAMAAASAPERVKQPNPFGDALPTRTASQSTTFDGSSRRPDTGDPAFQGYLGTIIRGVLGQPVDTTFTAAGNDHSWNGGASIPIATATADTPDDKWDDTAPAPAAYVVSASVQAEAFLDSMSDFNSSPVLQTDGRSNGNNFRFGFGDIRPNTPNASQPAASAPSAIHLDSAYEIDQVTGLNPARMAMIASVPNKLDSPPSSEPAMPSMPSDVPDESWVPGHIQYITNKPKITGFNTAPLPFNRLAGEKRPEGYALGMTALKPASTSAPRLENPNITYDDGVGTGASVTGSASTANAGSIDGGAEWGDEDGDAAKENEPAKPRYVDPDAADDPWGDRIALDY